MPSRAARSLSRSHGIDCFGASGRHALASALARPNVASSWICRPWPGYHWKTTGSSPNITRALQAGEGAQDRRAGGGARNRSGGGAPPRDLDEGGVGVGRQRRVVADGHAAGADDGDVARARGGSTGEQGEEDEQGGAGQQRDQVR